MSFIIGTPHTKGAGYSWSRYSAETKTVQDDVQTCPHCQAVIRMRQWGEAKAGKMAGGFCMKCNAPICPGCQAKMTTEGCVPFMKKLEAAFDMKVKYGQLLKDSGLEPASQQPPYTGIIKG